jgi:hypothetical protein
MGRLPYRSGYGYPRGVQPDPYGGLVETIRSTTRLLNLKMEFVLRRALRHKKNSSKTFSLLSDDELSEVQYKISAKSGSFGLLFLLRVLTYQSSVSDS